MSDILVIVLLTCKYQFQKSKVINYNLKVTFSRFSMSRFVDDIGNVYFMQKFMLNAH